MKKFFLHITLFFILTSCVSYSVLDASINAENFSVSIFEEQAANAPVGYGAQFTEFLKDFVIGRSSLKLANTEADLSISGQVVNYSVLPVAVQGNQTTAQNRLTITILVSVLNNKNPEESFEQRFSQFSDFDASSDLSSEEDALIEDINEKLGQDIINKLSSNW
ncbi:MAG: LPS assembly lipoprotein LptE [Crocinitomicaceae bacterium]